MVMKILITYSSGYGTTREVAERIAHILASDGDFGVTVESVDNVSELDDFDAIIVGSSVRADRPLANVRDFFAQHNIELAQKHLAIFAVCLAANCSEGRDRVKRDYIAQITDKYPAIKPFSTEAFGGKIDFEQLNPVMQQLMKRVLAKIGIESQGSVDTRDWDFIESWAVQVRDYLRQAA